MFSTCCLILLLKLVSTVQAAFPDCFTLQGFYPNGTSLGHIGLHVFLDNFSEGDINDYTYSTFGLTENRVHKFGLVTEAGFLMDYTYGYMAATSAIGRDTDLSRVLFYPPSEIDREKRFVSSYRLIFRLEIPPPQVEFPVALQCNGTTEMQLGWIDFYVCEQTVGLPNWFVGTPGRVNDPRYDCIGDIQIFASEATGCTLPSTTSTSSTSISTSSTFSTISSISSSTRTTMSPYPTDKSNGNYYGIKHGYPQGEYHYRPAPKHHQY
jgi:hypothetical protein